MQLEISLIISQIIAFLIMLWILKKFAWRPLFKILQERKDKIQTEFDSIDQQKKEVERLTHLYGDKLAQIEEEAKQKIAEAMDMGHKMAQKIQEEALCQAKAILAKTQLDIKNEIIKAQAGLKDQLVDLVIQATQRLICEKMDSEQDRKCIVEFLNTYKPEGSSDHI